MGFLSRGQGHALGSQRGSKGHVRSLLWTNLFRRLLGGKAEHVAGESATLVAVSRPDKGPGWEGAGVVTVILIFEAFGGIHKPRASLLYSSHLDQ